MGNLADIFVSRAEDAEGDQQSLLARTRGEGQRFVYVEYKGVTSLEFAQLTAILANEPFDDHKHQFPSHLADRRDAAEQLPPDAVALFSGMNPEALKTAAENWSGIEDLGCAPEVLEPILADLQRLARLAEQEGRGMYIWMSV